MMQPPGLPSGEQWQSTWQPYAVGQGRVETDLSQGFSLQIEPKPKDCSDKVPESEVGGESGLGPERVRLIKDPPPLGSAKDAAASHYSNAQIDDYHTLRRSDFLWHPPLRMSLQARFSHPVAEAVTGAGAGPFMSGTAGFGFWNDPFMMTGMRRPTLPRAIWFFYSSMPSDMQLAMGIPGWGWKAAVIDCLRPGFYSLLPTAPLGVLLMRSKLLYRWLWPIAQRAMNVEEATISAGLTEWRRYELEWLPNSARFWVDGELVCQTETAPRGPLGLVIWLDNQFMVVTPTGRMRSGLVPSNCREFLEIEELRITAGLC